MSEDDKKECALFDNFGLAVQFILGVLAFSSLLVKRAHEFPRRPFLIWWFDTSKQGFGAGISHMFNTSLGLLFQFGTTSSSPCTWYLIHLVLDSTVGVFINFVIITILAQCSVRFSSLDNGFYGHPPSHTVWLKQIGVWIMVVCMSKLIVILGCLIDIATQNRLETTADVLLRPIRISPYARYVELVFVMMLVPLFCTTFAFWIQDSFLKKSTGSATATWITYESLKLSDSHTNLPHLARASTSCQQSPRDVTSIEMR